MTTNLGVLQVHIGALLLAKFTSYQDFHTQLYTCAAEFDFLSIEVLYILAADVVIILADCTKVDYNTSPSIGWLIYCPHRH